MEARLDECACCTLLRRLRPVAPVARMLACCALLRRAPIPGRSAAAPSDVRVRVRGCDDDDDDCTVYPPLQMSGKGYVDGKVAVEGDFTFALAKAGKSLA